MRPNKRLQLQDIVNISNLEEPCVIPFSYFLSDDFVMYGQPAINYLHYLSRNWLEFKLFIQQNKSTELLRNIECIKLILTNHSKEASINIMNIWTRYFHAVDSDFKVARILSVRDPTPKNNKLSVDFNILDQGVRIEWNISNYQNPDFRIKTMVLSGKRQICIMLG